MLSIKNFVNIEAKQSKLKLAILILAKLANSMYERTGPRLKK